MRSGQGGIFTFDGEHFHVAATRGLSDAYATILRDNTYGQVKAGYAVDELSPREQLLNGVDLVHLTGPALAVGPIGQAAADLEKIGTALFVPLRRDAKLLGYITVNRVARYHVKRGFRRPRVGTTSGVSSYRRGGSILP
jgi:hypothetical protein